MNKERFLRQQYDRITTSGDFVWSGWREGFERFRTDLWDRTPASAGGRMLGTIDPTLGFAPGNVEWHFRRVSKAAMATAKPSRPKAKKEPREFPKTQRKANELTAREERRRKLAEEFSRWEIRRGSKGLPVEKT